MLSNTIIQRIKGRGALAEAKHIVKLLPKDHPARIEVGNQTRRWMNVHSFQPLQAAGDPRNGLIMAQIRAIKAVAALHPELAPILNV